MKQTDSTKVLLLAGMVIVISLLHYLTPTRYYVFHNVYIRLYYAPIVISAFWFGLRGAAATALLVSIVYLPHVLIQWSHDAPGNANRYIEIVLFNVIGIVVGVLARAERTHRERLAETASRLKESYAKLEEQTELLLETERQLMHSDRLAVLGELAATMAHEVRNPLASIKGALDILGDNKTSSSEKKEFLEIIGSEVKRLGDVVRNYLSVARRPQPTARSSDPAEVIMSVIALTQGRARKQGVTVEVSHVGPGGGVPIDPDLLRQILLNLFLNSLSAMDGGGTLSVSTARDSKSLAIRVKDNGRGISEDDLARVFRPFYTTNEDGSGLGLPIVKRIVEELGGSIDLTSEEGVGTEVRLLLPVRTE